MTFFTVTNGYPFGGFLIFFNTASAGNGTFLIEGHSSVFGSGGALIFADDSTAGNGSFTVNGGSVPGGSSGNIDFQGGTAGNGVFVINGGTDTNALGGSVLFSGGTAGNATLIANPGTNAGYGGLIRYAFTGTPDASEARIELFGNGTLDMTYGVNGGRTVGSIEGDGLIQLGGNQLITGANNLGTSFSGTIGPGSLTKIGAGTLTLTGANTYDGGATINDGALIVNNTTGSATGTGAVHVNAGRLGGKGAIDGTVVVGSGSGSGAALVPRKRGGRPDTLTIRSQLTFNSDARYTCELNTKSGRAGAVVANGVTIESGAEFDFVSVANKALMPGIVVALISNTSGSLISGTFANLPDGSTFTVGLNTFQASYSGGDGNDLILTVVP
jgi:autotransporter-associated beta strand protein